MKNRINKIILPFFPDNEWLKKQWWHRAIMVTAWLWFLLIMLYVVLLSNYVAAYNNLIAYHSANSAITLWDWLKYPLTFSLIIYTPIAMFAVNLAYRIFLFISTGNTWKLRK